MKEIVICILVFVFMFSGCSSEFKSGFFDSTTEENNIDSENRLSDTSSDTPDTLPPSHETVTNNTDISEREKKLCCEAAHRADVSFYSSFKADEVIPIDDVILYYELHMMRNERGALLPELKQYKCDTNIRSYVIRIPKEEVRNALQPFFSPRIDDAYSKYEDFEDNNYLILDADVRGLLFTRCNSYTRKGDIIEMEVEGGWVDPYPESGDGYNVDSKFILGVKLLGESEFMYMYYNITKNDSQDLVTKYYH